MALVAFDTLKMARTLRDQAKLSSEQAEGIAGAMAEAMSASELATKADLGDTRADLKADIAEFRAEVKAEVAELRAEIKAEISELRAEIKAEISELRAEIKAELKAEFEKIQRQILDIHNNIADSRADSLKTTMMMMVGYGAINIVAILGGMYGLVKLLGH